MPTDDPSPEGLTMRRGSAAPAANALSSVVTAAGSSRQRTPLTSRQSTTGRPSPRHIRLNRRLSIPSAEAATPAPV